MQRETLCREHEMMIVQSQPSTPMMDTYGLFPSTPPLFWKQQALGDWHLSHWISAPALTAVCKLTIQTHLLIV